MYIKHDGVGGFVWGCWLGVCVRYSNLYYSYLVCMISIYRKLKTCVGACVYMRRMQWSALCERFF